MKHMRGLVFLLTAAALSAQQPVAFLDGTVEDLHGAVIPNAAVEVSSAENRCLTRSNERGEFHCQLPPGRYRIAASSRAFFPYRRATINLNASDRAFLRVRTVPGPAIALWLIEGVGAVDVELDTNPVIHEEAFVGGDDVLIRFASVVRNGVSLKYAGPYLSLTMDRLTVHADEIFCTDPIRKCTAAGSVAVELGEAQITDTSVEIDLVDRKLVFRRDPSAVKTF